MRLPKEIIGRVRRGDLGIARRPVNNRPCPFKIGRYYALEKVEDRHEENCLDCAGEGCAECADHGTVVIYERRATTLEGEFVEVEAVERQPLHWADDREAQAWGFETREEYIDDWQAEHGRNVGDTYVIRFRYAVDMPHLLARNGGYTHSDFNALEGEPEGVGDDYLAVFAGKAASDIKRQQELRRLEQRRAELDARIDSLRRRDAA